MTGLAPGNQEDDRRGSAATIVISGRLEMKTKRNNYLKHSQIAVLSITVQGFPGMGNKNSSGLLDLTKGIFP